VPESGTRRILHRLFGFKLIVSNPEIATPKLLN
jgi:hypothetical protein